MGARSHRWILGVGLALAAVVAAACDDGGPDPVGPVSTSAVVSDTFPSLAGDTALLTHVRTNRLDTHQRVVLQFWTSDEPSYRVGYVEPPLIQPGTGREVEVDGGAFLEIRVTPAAGYDPAALRFFQTYTGPRRIAVDADGPVREVVLMADYESSLVWVVGVDRERPFAVATLEDPVRLVVDIMTPDEPGALQPASLRATTPRQVLSAALARFI